MNSTEVMFTLDLNNMKKSCEEMVEVFKTINEKKTEEPFNKFLKQIRRQQIAFDKETNVKFINLLLERKFENLVCDALDWLHEGDILKNEERYCCLELMLSQVWHYTALSNQFVQSLCTNTEMMDIFESLLTNKKCRKRISNDPRIKTILAITINIIENVIEVPESKQYFKDELNKGLQELAQCEQDEIRLAANLVLPKLSSQGDSNEEKTKEEIGRVVERLITDLKNDQRSEETLLSLSNMCFHTSAQHIVLREGAISLLSDLIKCEGTQLASLSATCLHRLTLNADIHKVILADTKLAQMTEM